MSISLTASYAKCTHVAKTEARNFYYSFTVLPPEKRAQMCAIYAFMRYSDDLSDEAALEDGRSNRLSEWRVALDRAFDGNYGDSDILPAFHDTAVKCNIPKSLFHELIDGAEMYLDTTRYQTFEELYTYCYRVASVVGLVCIRVWGYDNQEAALAPAEACGIAFQLTNILRDVKEDAERGRIYLPLEDLQKFGVSEESLLHGEVDENFYKLMQFEAARAKDYYEKALPLIPMIDPVSRPTFVVMYRIYRDLLTEIEKCGYRVFDKRASLPTAKKLWIVAHAWLGSRIRAAGSIRT
ncbi:MAG: phytoene/squalene synthase family protein [Chthonomonadales bacterium]